MRVRAAAWVAWLALGVIVPGGSGPANAAEDPERVTFRSADGKTKLVGYVFKPARMPAARVPAVVMMHGRAGAYSSQAGGVSGCVHALAAPRHVGRVLGRERLHRDPGRRLRPARLSAGLSRFSYKRRPPELDEVTIRPLDAYGALTYLRSRPDVLPGRIGLLGWSNGGSSTLAAMSRDTPGIAAPKPATGFRAALAFYPACGLKGRFDDGYRPYAPVRIFHGTDDEEVSPRRCGALVEKSRALGGDIAIRLYEGATHGFDDPGRKRQRLPANAAAFEDAMKRTRAFFARELEP